MLFGEHASIHEPAPWRMHDSASCLGTGTCWAHRRRARAGNVSSASGVADGTPLALRRPCTPGSTDSRFAGSGTCWPRRTGDRRGIAYGNRDLSGCSPLESPAPDAPDSRTTCSGTDDRVAGLLGWARASTHRQTDGRPAHDRRPRTDHSRFGFALRSIPSNPHPSRPSPKSVPRESRDSYSPFQCSSTEL